MQLVGQQAPYDSSVADGDSCNFALYGVNDPACQPFGICCYCNKCGGNPDTCNALCGAATTTTTSSSPTYTCQVITLDAEVVLPGSMTTITVDILEGTSTTAAQLFLLDDAGQEVAVYPDPTITADEDTIGLFHYQFDATLSSSISLGVYAVRFSHSGTINDVVIDPAECTPVLTISDTLPTTTTTSSTTTTTTMASTPTTTSPVGGIGGSDTPVADQPDSSLPDTGLLDDPSGAVLLGITLLIFGFIWLRTNISFQPALIWGSLISLVPGYKTLEESRHEFEDKFD